jgi:peptide chain release factor 1
MPTANEQPTHCDQRTAFMEIHARGQPSVAAGVRLARMYRAFADSRGWQVRVVWPYPLAGTGAVLDAVIQIAEPGAYEMLKHESGLHRIHLRGEVRAGRALQGTAEVRVLPEATEDEIGWREVDLRIDVYRHSSDPDLGISSSDPVLRITHLPTGTQVLCHKPRNTTHHNPCLLALQARLLDRQRTRGEQQAALIRTYDLTTEQVLDTRLPAAFAGASVILDGDLTPLLDELWLHGAVIPPDSYSVP